MQANVEEQWNNFAQTTRFVFVCNDITKIIEPIQSRCSMIRYTKLNKHDIIKKIKNICENENINITENGINAIVCAIRW